MLLIDEIETVLMAAGRRVYGKALIAAERLNEFLTSLLASGD